MVPLFIDELAVGAPVCGEFTLRSRELKTARNGDPYLRVGLADGTGVIRGIQFRPPVSSAVIAPGSVVSASGRVTAYGGRKRLTISSLRLSGASGSTQQPLTPWSKEHAERALSERVRRIASPELSRVVAAAYAEPDLLGRLSSLSLVGDGGAPCSVLEHTLAVCDLCADVASQHVSLDGDLLQAAALLHDIGFVDAVTPDAHRRPTQAGKLLGHAVLSAMRVNAACRAAKAVEGAAARLQYIVLIHHGHVAGAQTGGIGFEAAALAYVDRLHRDECPTGSREADLRLSA